MNKNRMFHIALVFFFCAVSQAYADQTATLLATASMATSLDLTMWIEKMDPKTKDVDGNDSVVNETVTSMAFGTLRELLDDKNNPLGVYTSAYYYRVMLVANTTNQKYRITQSCTTTDQAFGDALVMIPMVKAGFKMASSTSPTGFYTNTQLWEGTDTIADDYQCEKAQLAVGAERTIVTVDKGRTGIIAVNYGLFDGSVVPGTNTPTVDNAKPMLYGTTSPGGRTATITFTLVATN